MERAALRLPFLHLQNFLLDYFTTILPVALVFGLVNR